MTTEEKLKAALELLKEYREGLEEDGSSHRYCRVHKNLIPLTDTRCAICRKLDESGILAEGKGD